MEEVALAQDKTYNIAVVDDEETVTFAIKKALRRERSYRVHTFNSPTEAVRTIQSIPLDLIISDYMMPDMTGVELLKEIGVIFPEATRIMLTAYADKDNVIRAINEVGLFFYLEKPWDNDDLRIIIQRGLEKRDFISDLKNKVRELEISNRQLRDARAELLQGERLSAVGQMASSIIHDFKNPMTSILGFSELLLMPEYNQKEREEIFDTIKEEINRMVEMTNDILDFSRGTITLQKEKVILSEFIGSTLTGMERFMKQAEVRVEADNGFDGKVRIDPRRFRRVFDNLLKNAAEAMPEGGAVAIRTRAEDGKVFIEVKDTGRGIPTEIREKIFEPFVTAGKSHGTGLGMAIVKKIVEAHDGSIDFESEAGRGTTFTIAVPVAD